MRFDVWGGALPSGRVVFIVAMATPTSFDVGGISIGNNVVMMNTTTERDRTEQFIVLLSEQFACQSIRVRLVIRGLGNRTHKNYDIRIEQK